MADFDLEVIDDVGKALELAAKKLGAVQKSGNPVDEANAMLKVAWAQLSAGSPDEALQMSEGALDMLRKAKVKDGEAAAQNLIAKASLAKGETDDATRAIKKALDICKGLGNTRPAKKQEAATLATQAELQMAAGLGDTAVATAEKSAQIFKLLGDPKKEIMMYHTAMKMHLGLDHVNRALGLAKNAVESAKATGQSDLIASALAAQADVHLTRGETQEAQLTAQEAVGIYKQIADTSGEGGVLQTWMKAQLAESKPYQAIETAVEAAGLFESVGNKHGQATFMLEAADVLLGINAFEEALGYSMKSGELLQQVGDKRLGEKCLNQIKAAKKGILSNKIHYVLDVSGQRTDDLIVDPGLIDKVKADFYAGLAR